MDQFIINITDAIFTEVEKILAEEPDIKAQQIAIACILAEYAKSDMDKEVQAYLIKRCLELMKELFKKEEI